MKILLLNGAPRSGKDTISTMLKKNASTSVHQEKFALPMKLSVPLIYGVPRHKWENELDTARNKDLACTEFFGETPRDVQIGLSEDFLKPLHGKKIFGELLERRIKNIAHRSELECIVVSDSGFYDEAKHIIDVFGADNIQLWRIHRAGCNFSGDSRGHIDLDDENVDSYDIVNDGSLDDLRCLVLPLYEALILPRETLKDPITKEQSLESEKDWQARRRLAAKAAFEKWPERKIELIRKSENATQD